MNPRRDGHAWERYVVSWLSDIFNLEKLSRKNEVTAQIATSRAMSKGLDNRGIDIWFGQVPEYIDRLKIQCKKTLNKAKNTVNIDIASLYSMQGLLPTDIPLLYTRVTEKRGKRQKIVHEVVTMDIKTFNKFLKCYERVLSESSHESKLS